MFVPRVLINRLNNPILLRCSQNIAARTLAKYDYDFPAKDEIVQNDDFVELNVKIPGFKIDDITVKTVNGEYIHVEAQDKNNPKGKHFLKKYCVPISMDMDSVTSVLNKDGVLTITAPRIAFDDEERLIPINSPTTKTEEEKVDFPVQVNP